MVSVNKKFALINILAFVLLLATGLILRQTLLKEYYNYFYFILLFTALLLNFIVHLFNSTISKVPKKLTSSIIISFGIKFFGYIILTILYLLLFKEKTDRIVFIVHLFAVYILFSVIEIKYRP
jgi:hypothetical protein